MGCIKCGSSVQNKDMYCNDCRPDYFKEASGERNTDENGMFNVNKFRQGSPIKFPGGVIVRIRFFDLPSR